MTDDDLAQMVDDIAAHLGQMRLITDMLGDMELTEKTLQNLFKAYSAEIATAEHVLEHLEEALQARGLIDRTTPQDDDPDAPF